MAELKPGITGKAEDAVTEERTAASMGSGASGTRRAQG